MVRNRPRIGVLEGNGKWQLRPIRPVVRCAARNRERSGVVFHVHIRRKHAEITANGTNVLEVHFQAECIAGIDRREVITASRSNNGIRRDVLRDSPPHPHYWWFVYRDRHGRVLRIALTIGQRVGECVGVGSRNVGRVLEPTVAHMLDLPLLALGKTLDPQGTTVDDGHGFVAKLDHVFRHDGAVVVRTACAEPRVAKQQQLGAFHRVPMAARPRRRDGLWTGHQAVITKRVDGHRRAFGHRCRVVAGHQRLGFQNHIEQELWILTGRASPHLKGSGVVDHSQRAHVALWTIRIDVIPKIIVEKEIAVAEGDRVAHVPHGRRHSRVQIRRARWHRKRFGVVEQVEVRAVDSEVLTHLVVRV